jgi:hypothetical protein
MLSVALAVIVDVPLTVELFAGAVRDTVGAVVSLTTDVETMPDWPTLPAASYALTIHV